jgi:flavin reductase (DIM6/NTAB) family NADH-FMN oxidoreductase RutF
MTILDPDDLSGRTVYGLLTSLVIPRPIALVTTESRDGVLNCAPFSFYQGVCGSPPIISLSIARNRSGLKDTFRNILLDSEFVVHTPRTEHLDQVERTAESFDPEVSEVEEIGFHPTESEEVEVRGLEEPPVRMECRLHDQFPIAGGKVTVLYGEIVCFHLDEDVYDGEYVDYDALDPLGRLGPDAYTNLGEYLEPTQSVDSGETATSDDPADE